MDNRPIGFFDSGVGGITSIPHIMRLMPDERIIFFGDTARTPYGSKSEDTIRQFAAQIGDFLVSKGVKMIVIACNTVSATCLTMLRERFPGIPVIGVISPTAREIRNRRHIAYGKGNRKALRPGGQNRNTRHQSHRKVRSLREENSGVLTGA